MAFTSHGHFINGSGFEENKAPEEVTNCGGTPYCPECKAEQQAFLGGRESMTLPRYTIHGWPMPGTPKTDDSRLAIVPECTGPYDCRQCLAEMKQDFVTNNPSYKKFWGEAMEMVHCTLNKGPEKYKAWVKWCTDHDLPANHVAADENVSVCYAYANSKGCSCCPESYAKVSGGLKSGPRLIVGKEKYAELSKHVRAVLDGNFSPLPDRNPNPEEASSRRSHQITQMVLNLLSIEVSPEE